MKQNNLNSNELNPKHEYRNPKQLMNLFLNSKFNHSKFNQSGFTMMVLLAAFLVLFTTVSFIKLGTLDSIDPDLRRIGININPDSTPAPLAENETTNPTQADSEAGDAANKLTIASSSLNIDADADIENEGDNPTYIE